MYFSIIHSGLVLADSVARHAEGAPGRAQPAFAGLISASRRQHTFAVVVLP
jgi:hypothetical protein